MNGIHAYRVYGISLRSEIPLGLPECSSADGDVFVRLQRAEWFERAIAGAPLNQAAHGWYEFADCPDGSVFVRWPGLFEFLVSPDGRTIACHPLERSRPESFETYLLGQVLSCALVRQHHEPLHATSVVVNGGAVAFLGVSGQGKSTLAAAFLGAGYRLLTDDLLLIRDIGGILCGFPGPPRIKLFPEVAQRFLPAEALLAPMNPESNKQIIALPSSAAYAAPVPIHALFVLDGMDEGRLNITSLTRASSCVALLGSTFNKRLVDADRLRRQFAAATAWTAKIPVKRLRYGWSMDFVDDVVRAIVSDVIVARESVM